MQLIWIEAFVAVVDHHGFAPAAAHLFRSQGRVSTYVAMLEHELGAQLFDRGVRPARLSAEGEAFLPHARSMLHGLDSAIAAISDVQGLTRGTVAVGTFSSAAATFLTHVISRFDDAHPDVEVKLVENQTRALDVAFDADEFELMIRPAIPRPLCRRPFRYQPLWQEGICAIVPEGHRLAAYDVIAAEDLAPEPLAVGGHSREDAEIPILLERQGVHPTVRYLSNQSASILTYARRGLAVGVMNVLATRALSLDGVSVRPLERTLTREVGLYSHVGVTANTVVGALHGAILTTATPHGVTDLRARERDGLRRPEWS